LQLALNPVGASGGGKGCGRLSHAKACKELAVEQLRVSDASVCDECFSEQAVPKFEYEKPPPPMRLAARACASSVLTLAV
jgi:hypothetical protein